MAIQVTNPFSSTIAASSSRSRKAGWYCLKKCMGSTKWLPYWAKKLANIGLGSGNTYWKVKSSIFTNSQPCTSRYTMGDISGSIQTCLRRNQKSSAVSGAPSDHLMPARSLTVVMRPSSLKLQDSARLGRTLRMSAERVSACSQLKNCQLSQMVVRAVPPYLPIDRYGSMTTGSSGRRSSTEGRSRPSR